MLSSYRVGGGTAEGVAHHTFSERLPLSYSIGLADLSDHSPTVSPGDAQQVEWLCRKQLAT